MMKQLKVNHLIFVLIALAIICASLARAAEDESKSSDEDAQQAAKEKRPFCNAFAGCGRKRAALVKEMQNIALGRALPTYAYYSNSDLKLLKELFAKFKQHKTSSEEDDDSSKH